MIIKKYSGIVSEIMIPLFHHQTRTKALTERLSLEKHKAKEKAVGLNIQEYISAIHTREKKTS